MATETLALATDLGPPAFLPRLKKRLFDPAVLAGPPTAATLCLFRHFGLVAALPYWLIVTLVLAAQLLSICAAALWADRDLGRGQLTAYVGVVMGVIGAIAYSTGWGPILSLGFIFGAAYAFQLSGSMATMPCLIWTVVYMGLGQLLIGLGLMPTLIKRPLVHGLAGLGLLGVLLTIGLLAHVTVSRERAEEELAHSERRFKALVRNSSDIIIVTDADGMMQYVSPAFESLLGFHSHAFKTRPLTELIHPDDLSSMQRDDPANRGISEWKQELRLQDARGRWRSFEATVTDRRHDPDITGYIANLHDITDRKKTEEALREAHERFRSAFENAPIGMAMADLKGNILRANAAYGKILGASPRELKGVNVHELTHPEDRDSSSAEMRRVVTGEIDGYQIEKRYQWSNGPEVWVSVNVSCVRDSEDKPLYLIGQIEDITDRRAFREHLARTALHDGLTALPNRVLFMDRLQGALQRTFRNTQQVAVIFLDIDRFKLVNDSLGHDGGDRLLQTVAQRLKGSIRPSDTVARFGGDEFTILCEEVPNELVALELARRVVSSFETPIVLEGTEVFVTASLGVALGRGDATPDKLVRDADTAMYRAKERGRASIELFDEDDDSWTMERLRTGNDLHLAIQREEFELHYQPWVDLNTRTMVGTEALVRWRHPTRGLLAPGSFIDLAEDTGLISRLGAWVLGEACRQTARWHEERSLTGGEIWRQVTSINVSPRQLADRSFSDSVLQAIETAGIDPEFIWLEITENSLLHDAERSIATLRALRERGLHIAIDDFGTGYSSLSYLRQLPAECVKIDRAFIDGIDRDPESATIVKAIIALAESLGLACIAEGVETEAQMKTLMKLGCHLAQGYLLGRPSPASRLAPFPADDLSSWLVAR